ncbi:gluconate 2-dehydrogenase subunit 3 family protein [bacterium]|nr:gluconate 2-dehydrogenase subunit 3 family protein [bacterium]MBU1994928.1 gluconate 2-dehydrogenase subunit 3 family protein [bacterium]
MTILELNGVRILVLKSRRTFLKETFFTGAVLVMSGTKLFGAVTPLQTITAVQEDLFPHAKSLGANASAYVSTVFHHSRVSEEEKNFIRNGVQWLNEEAVALYKTTYIKLTPTQRQNVLIHIAQERWGERWIETLLSYIMEAMLGDPIYGINKNEAGWTWLHHSSGLPRPTKAFL